MSTLDLSRFDTLTANDVIEAVAEAGHPRKPVEAVFLSINGMNTLTSNAGLSCVDHFVIDDREVRVLLKPSEGASDE